MTVLAAAVALAPASAAPGDTTLVSVDSDGNKGIGAANLAPAINGDGTVVAFDSAAANLVPGDTNGASDVFVHDLATGITTLVSVDLTGQPGGGSVPNLSADGTRVVFQSDQPNHVPGDTNGTWDIFVRDLVAGTTTRVSVDSAGNQGDGPSAGSNVVGPSISAEGTRVAFESSTTNLVPGDTNATGDVFVHDLETGATTRVSVDSAGNQGNSRSGQPSLSGDGSVVAFQSFATNLVPGDLPFERGGWADIFVHDLETAITIRISVDYADPSRGANFQSNHPSINADGTKVVFGTSADNVVPSDMEGGGQISDDIFLHDLSTRTTSQVSLDNDGNDGNERSQVPDISADGTRVAFQSLASNLVEGDINRDFDVFVRDLTTGTIYLASVDSNGNQGVGFSFPGEISGDGTAVAFQSIASFAPQDTGGFDIYHHELDFAPSTSTTTTLAPTTTTLAPTTTTLAPTTTTLAPPDAALTIDDSALSDGRVMRVTGTIICDEGRRFQIRLGVAQGDTAAQGVVTGTCAGGSQNFRVNMLAASDAGFDEGIALVDAAASIAGGGRRSIGSTFSTSEEVRIEVPGRVIQG